MVIDIGLIRVTPSSCTDMVWTHWMFLSVNRRISYSEKIENVAPQYNS